LVEHWQAQVCPHPSDGPAATSLFIGRVRGSTAVGLPLEALELEHYPGMSEWLLEALARACAERHGVQAVLAAHRVGRLPPGEAIVVVAVGALELRQGAAGRTALARAPSNASTTESTTERCVRASTASRPAFIV
jgi:molybdopterin synthase catalytic subunit